MSVSRQVEVNNVWLRKSYVDMSFSIILVSGYGC